MREGERQEQPEEREHDPGDDRADQQEAGAGQRRDDDERDPGASPARAASGKPASAAPAMRSHLPNPVRPSPEVKSR